MLAALKGLDGVVAKTGFFETSKYDDGTPVAFVAAVQEFGAVINVEDAAAAFQGGSSGGSIVIPPRPFFRPTIANKSAEWGALIGRGAHAVLTQGADPVDVMEAVALRAAGDVAKTISTVTSPPLKPSTIRRKKGATKPLVDTGLMIQSVTGVAERKT